MVTSTPNRNLFAGILSLSCVCGPVTAQQSNDINDDELEEIVITAQRRVEDVQKVASAVTAISGDKLNDKAITRLDDLQFAIPSLTISDAGLTQSVNIRGIGLASGSPAVTPGIATYVDGVAQPPIVTTGSFYDMESVEVMRGPQGTFVGSASTGGAIFLSSRNPELNKTDGYVEAALGNYSNRSAQGAINLPAGEKFAFRVAGTYRQRDSYYTDIGPFDNHPDRLDEAGGRVGMLWQPTDSFQGIVKLEYVDRQTGGYAFRPGQGALTAPLRSSDIRTLTYDDPTSNHERAKQATLELRQEAFGGITFRYLGGYQDKRINNLYDLDGTIQPPQPNPYTRTSMDQFVREQVYTHEINVISPINGAFDWIVGGYWQRNKIIVDITQQNTPGTPLDIDVNTEKTVSALFAQAGYKITQTLKLNVGARYNTFDASGGGSVVVGRGLPFPPFNGTGLQVADLSGSHDDARATGKVAIEWTANNDNLLYAFVARGYKPGGFNSAVDEFDPETVWDYELGWKSTLLDGRLRTQFGAFWNDYTGFQLDGLNPETGRFQTFNVANATVRGLEAQAQARLGGWGFDVGVSYVDSSLSEVQFVDTRTLPPGTNLPQCAAGALPGTPATCFDYGPYIATADGGPLLYSPGWTFNAGAEYTIPMGDNASLRPRVNYGYVGSQYTTLLYLPTDRLGSRGLLSAQLTYSRDSWMVEAYGTNLTDKDYLSGGGGQVEYYGAPREYGLRVSMRF